MKLTVFLKKRGVNCEPHRHPAAFTSQELAHEEHVSGYMVAKPVIVKGNSGFAMCVLPAPNYLDHRRAAEALKEPEVRLATESEMAKLFPECELGAEPPIGPMFGLRTVMDARLRADDYLVMQAGTHTEAIRMRRADWERVCEPVVAPISLS